MNTENQAPPKKTGYSMQLVVVLVLAVLLVIFTLQNQERVSVRLCFWSLINVPVPLLITICMLLGYLIPYILFIPRIWKLKRELNRTRREKEELEEVRQEP